MLLSCGQNLRVEKDKGYREQLDLASEGHLLHVAFLVVCILSEGLYELEAPCKHGTLLLFSVVLLKLTITWFEI